MTIEPGIGTLREVRIEEEMRSSYLDYAMSVIVARALPDVRDGLKPVQRRILYAMDELALRPTSPHKKSARLVGEVLGKYHPHGDSPVYEALVRMAQGFSMRYPLVNGQGNFGSVDGDPPAAMRYTEVRLSRVAEEMLDDIDRDTVDFVLNFDGSVREPTILPARLPNLLANGSTGIAVGMATSIPPHNLRELCDAIIHIIDHPDADVDDLMRFIKAPDFPSAGIIYGREGIRNAFATGRGKVLLRGRATIEELRGARSQIIITEIPYQVNKASLVERIADLSRNRRVEGISEVRDESDREGMRVVVELRRDAFPEQVLNNLYKHTALQQAFHINMLALVDGAPRVINLPQALKYYVDFRREVVVRRSEFDLRRARERAHILEGLKKALDYLDEVISTIRQSDNADHARTQLMERFQLTIVQAQAILEMQLRRLAALERRRILEELEQVQKQISELEVLLASEAQIYGVIKEETATLRKEYGDERRTEIRLEEPEEFQIEDLIPNQEMVVTLSARGYAKYLPTSTYRVQHRGGRGITGMVTREEDGVQHLLVADTHDTLLFFTNTGRVLPLKTYQIPKETSRTAKGQPLVNLLPSLSERERITTVLAPERMAGVSHLLLATRQGQVKRTALAAYAHLRQKGLVAMNLRPNDELISVRLVEDATDAILVTQQGCSLRFPVSEVTAHSRQAGGMRGVRLVPGDQVVGMDALSPRGYLLTVSQQGYGKLTAFKEYRVQKRGGMGIKTFQVTKKTGPVVATVAVQPQQEILVISAQGIVLRTSLEEIRITHRVAQGVRIIHLEPNDVVASVACFDASQPEAEKE